MFEGIRRAIIADDVSLWNKVEYTPIVSIVAGVAQIAIGFLGVVYALCQMSCGAAYAMYTEVFGLEEDRLLLLEGIDMAGASLQRMKRGAICLLPVIGNHYLIQNDRGGEISAEDARENFQAVKIRRLEELDDEYLLRVGIARNALRAIYGDQVNEW